MLLILKVVIFSSHAEETFMPAMVETDATPHQSLRSMKVLDRGIVCGYSAIRYKWQDLYQMSAIV
jgi:hypothetical protein